MSVESMIKSLEASFMRARDARVLVWVVFLAETSICFLDLAVGGILFDPEQL